VDEIQVLIDRARELSPYRIGGDAFGARVGGGTTQERHALAVQISDALNNLDIPPDRQEELRRAFDSIALDRTEWDERSALGGVAASLPDLSAAGRRAGGALMAVGALILAILIFRD
jgi:hypothetical protein